MKILHINSYYSASPFYQQLYDRQIERGEDIQVFVPVADGYDAKNRDFGPYTCVSPDHGRYDNLLYHVKHNKMLKDAERRYDAASFDVIHAHTLFSNGYVAYHLHKKYHTPYIVAVRSSDTTSFFRYMPHLRPLGRRILADAERVIFLSPAYRDKNIKQFLSEEEYRALLSKSEVLPNGIAQMWHDNKAAPRICPKGAVNILSIGNIEKNKNFGTTLAAVELLRKDGLDARLTIVGKSLDEKELAKIKACPFAEYHEPMPPTELIKFYRANDLFVLPSIRETFGLVYAEAMSQGLPVVYSAGQGFDGQFPEGEVGYRAPAKDARAIADAVKKILTDYESISRRAIECSARFDWNELAMAYAKLYREVR